MKFHLLVILLAITIRGGAQPSSVTRGGAQPGDSNLVLAGKYFRELSKACSAPRAKLWRKPLCGPVLLVDRETHTVYANQPDQQGFLHPQGDIYTGHLPEGVAIANTSTPWGRVTWAMALLPLYGNDDDHLDLLLHESFHRIQDSLGLPGNSPVCDHLDTEQGRIWLRLELRALVAALSKPAGERGPDLENALLFRAERYALFPDASTKEKSLEWNEGLAEFTGVQASGIADRRPGYFSGLINADTIRPSFARSFAYFTGPLYGVLLTQRRPGWEMNITSKDDFPDLVVSVYGLRMPVLPSLADLRLRAKPYSEDQIVRWEDSREQRRLAQEKEYRALLVDGPVLMIATTQQVHFSFNPNDLFAMGEEGTVYPEMDMNDDWGHLVDTGGARFQDWKRVFVPLGPAGAAGAQGAPGTERAGRLSGPGWTLDLAEGWQVLPGARSGDLVLVRKP